MTTNQDPIETVVRRVAEGLGWEYFTYEDGNFVLRPVGHCNLSIDAYGDGLLVIAAYAEAACDRVMSSGGSVLVCDERGVWSEAAKYNRANQDERAIAVLHAVAGIFSSGAPMTPPGQFPADRKILTIQVYHPGPGDAPFICGVNGHFLGFDAVWEAINGWLDDRETAWSAKPAGDYLFEMRWNRGDPSVGMHPHYEMISEPTYRAVDEAIGGGG